MLLCSTEELTPGVIVGASLRHPRRPELELLAPGARLDARRIAALARLGIEQVWIHHDATEGLDASVAENMGRAQQAVFDQLRRVFSTSSMTTLSSAQVNACQRVVLDLICDLVSAKPYAGLAARLQSTAHPLFEHCASVAYLSILAGLELAPYLIRERPRLDAAQATDLTGLGLGAMLHDIGKLALPDDEVADIHEAHDPQREDLPEGYRDHTIVGRQMLLATRAPASARQTVLMHHQRSDGSGWPTPGRLNLLRWDVIAGPRIHVFSRIVAAANVLDNLLSDARGARRPPVAALADFASPRFDGWFDPVVRRTLLRIVPPFAVASRVELSDARAAVVIAPNRDEPCRPLVRLLEEPRPDTEGPTMIDLSRTPSLRIVRSAGRDVSDFRYDLPAPTAPAEPEPAGQPCGPGPIGRAGGRL